MKSKLNDFIKFLKSSPSSYHAIDNVRDRLERSGCSFSEVKKGNTLVFTKENVDGATLVAFKIGNNLDNPRFKVISSHADSPWFKVASLNDQSLEGLNVIETNKYGSPILSTWYDRPLLLTGKVSYKDKSSELVRINDKTFMIPNLCSHFSRYIEDDSLIKSGNPVVGTKESLSSILKSNLKGNLEDISEYNLHFANKEEPIIWGDEKEFISSARLDNLASVYTSLVAFENSFDDNNISVLYISDNEEIGSRTDVGAFSTFLKDKLEYVCKSLNLDYDEIIKKSFMISADNAQGVNPYFSYIFNPDYKVYLNKGIAIKNSERYSTTPDTRNIMIDICKKAKVPYQIYYNRSDIPGGGTIGKIVTTIIDIPSVDVGIPELAMHSSYETIGTVDLKETIKLFTYFYSRY